MKPKNAMTIAVGFILVILAAVIYMRLTHNSYRFKGTLIDPPVTAFDFSLTDVDGNVFHLDEQKGKVVLIFFGYTHCPDVCPTTLAHFKLVSNDLGDKASDVRFLFITVDPERDTPELAARYARAFNPAFIGLSGSEEELSPIYQRYGVFREKQDVQTADVYLVAHTSVVYVIDKQGNWRLTFPFEMDPKDIESDLSYLLSE